MKTNLQHLHWFLPKLSGFIAELDIISTQLSNVHHLMTADIAENRGKGPMLKPSFPGTIPHDIFTVKQKSRHLQDNKAQFNCHSESRVFVRMYKC